ncbi:phage tail protein [Azospirillum sp. TSH64]|uniref:phage tail protein n=1 Tax=Azospirillum sp. TSH64 TaxID=652740 RepID=UPI0018EE9540|nr:phage tail protein [Azospirillum sp. TSH64]
MLALGEYRFSIDTAAYQTLQRSTEYRWPSQDRLGRAPALQFLGPGTDQISLAGTIFPQFRGGIGQLDKLRAEAGKGEPLLLVDGRGRVHGKYVVTKIEETQALFLSDGTPRKVDFSLELLRYGDDSERGSEANVSSVISDNTLSAAERELRDSAAAVKASALPSLEAMGLAAWDEVKVGPAGAVLATALDVSREAGSAISQGLQAVGVPVDGAGGSFTMVAAAAARSARAVGIELPGMGRLAAIPALADFSRAVGTDPVSFALNRLPGSLDELGRGLGALAIDTGEFASRFVENPTGTLLGVADRLREIPASTALSIASRLVPGRGAGYLTAAAKGIAQASSASGAEAIRWNSPRPDPVVWEA